MKWSSNPIVQNFLGGLAAAFVGWLAATATGSWGFEPIEATIETINIHNPLARKGVSSLAVQNYLSETLKVDNAWNLLMALDRAPRLEIAVLHLNNLSNGRSKQVEVAFRDGAIAFPGRQLTEPPNNLVIESLPPKSINEVYLISPAGPKPTEKTLNVFVDGKLIDVSDMRLNRLPFGWMAPFIFDNQNLIAVLAAIGSAAALYFVGYVGARTYRSVKKRRSASAAIATAAEVLPAPEVVKQREIVRIEPAPMKREDEPALPPPQKKETKPRKLRE
jgi:hypothetical protein